ncbi:ATP-dependent DNA helicase RecQ [Candidatus Pacearchaeota archaeon]|nr:ATP-dependent DNA helicase RecQ [Candidatus Pacearchaeota archaeon]
MKILLKKYFGYDNFRPMQEEIINKVLQKKDTFVLMPTGGGKSLCYQLPALKFEGITIVISPLISLMKDQVDNLKANGISAEYINSSLSFEEIIEIQRKIREKETQILYIAPERLASEEFKSFLTALQISLIAIDEAHCISEWGHDFRQEYRNLKFLKIAFPRVPIIALTATATEKVKEDILKQLSLKEPQVFVSSFDRKNLNLIVIEKKRALNKILAILKKYKKESVIIYCFSRKDSENIAQRLRENGFNALPYHAGLNNEIRKHNQELFIKDEVNIIVATIAFGMGIDKPDVRLIIHHTFPKTLEGYYQEIGRAGRDGIPSDCILFYSWGDKRKHEFFINQLTDEFTQEKERVKLRKVMNYCECVSCRRKHVLRYFGENFPRDNCNGCDICLEFPEIKESVLKDKVRLKKERKILDYNKNLFEKLRTLRKQIANERNVPPFVIFGDFSLQEMAYYLPNNKEGLLEINGVGEHKLKDFGYLFLEAINEYLKENNLDSVTIPQKDETKVDSKTDYHKRLEEIKEKFPNAYEPWEEEEDNKLKDLYSKNILIDEIAQILKRQPSAIRSRLKKVGLLE